MRPERPQPMQITEPVQSPSAEHLLSMHAFPTPVVMEGLTTMAERGAAPRQVLEDLTGTAFHVWTHRRGERGVAGSPHHSH